MGSVSDADIFDRRITNLGVQRIFRHNGQVIELACLVRTADWRPLAAPWWRGKEVCIIGADLEGNFLLRHCDGSVRHWRHQTQADVVVAKSVREFAEHIGE
jgi:hypothetical protein